MLRIVTVVRGGGGVSLRVEGTLTGESVGVLEQESLHHLEGARAVRLELDGVTFVDDEGVALLLELSDRGVTMTGSSAFVQARLNRGRT